MTSDQSGKLRTHTTDLKRENHKENSDATFDETQAAVCLEIYILRHYAEERLKSLGVLQ